MSNDELLFYAPRTPFNHKDHTNGVPCGCWVGKGDSVTCCCGASYILSDVMTFFNFICYDCGRIVSPPCRKGDRPIGRFKTHEALELCKGIPTEEEK